MTLADWRKWLAKMPWEFKWFPILVLLRPFIDNLYYLKKVSPFLSPPYIAGVLTPLFCIYVIRKYALPARESMDKRIIAWSVVLLLSCLALYFSDPLSMLNLQFLLKLTLPIYLYFFLRRMIRSTRDLEGIMLTFWISFIPVAGLLLFEIFIHPLRLEESRGLERIQGSFGDVVSYGLYITFGALIAAYFYLRDKVAIGRSRRIFWFLLTLGIGLLGLFNIHHIASYVIFIFLVFLFMNFEWQRGGAAALVVICVLAFGASIWGESTIQSHIDPLLQTDIRVYEGKVSSDRLLHGRVGRWRDMWQIFSDQEPYVQFLGYPLTLRYAYQFVGVGAHNDFFRLLFLTGFVGLFIYFLVLQKAFQLTRHLVKTHKFLITGILLIILLYSISTTPTFYAPMMYLCMAAMAFLALQEERRQDV